MTNELIPANPLPLPGFELALANMDTLEHSIEPLAARAQALQVKDADSFAEAGQIIAQLKNLSKESEACMAPYKIKVRQVLDFLQTRFNRNKNRAEELHGILNKKMGDYSRLEREAAAAEEKKLNKKAAEPVTVQPNLPKTAGVRNTTNYPITIEDPKILIRALLKAYKAADTKRVQFLAQFVTVDRVKLAEYARELKDPQEFNKSIPGVKCEAVEAFGGKA
jgi:hypothetical protein